MQQRTIRTTLLASVASVLGVVPAMADDGSHAGGGRSGATFSIGIGGGQLGCTNGDGDPCTNDGPSEAGTFFAQAGGMLSPRMALVGHLAIAAHQDGDVTVSQTILAAAVRGWAMPRLWFEGGLGIAQARVDVDGEFVDLMSESDTVPAIIAGVGVELLSTETFALDVHLRAGTGLYRDDVSLYQASLGVGASFF